jgi:RND family efflux transporter MFP subunit
MVSSAPLPKNASDAILNAAEDVVRQDGAAHLTLDAVAAKAGISKGGLLYHFHTKEALIQAMIKRLSDTVTSIAKQNEEKFPPGPARLLKSHICAMDEMLEKKGMRGVFAALLAAAAHDHKLLDPIRAVRGNLLEELNATGLPDAFNSVIFLALEGLWMTELLDVASHSRKERQAVISQLLSLVDGEERRLLMQPPKKRAARGCVKRTTALIAMLAALWFATGCGSTKEKASLGFAQAAAAANGDTSASAALAIVPVATAAVSVAERNDPIGLTGTLKADEQARVASKVSGIVQKVFVDRGSLVRQGDKLVQLDTANARNSLAEGQAAVDELRARLGLHGDGDDFDAKAMPEVKAVKASMDLAERNYARYKELSDRNAVAKLEFDRVSSEFDALREQYQQAQHQAQQLYQSYKTALTHMVTLRQALADTLTVAPFDGMVAEKIVTVGERVEVMMGGGQVIVLVKVNPLRLTLTVPQQYVGLIHQDQLVTFKVEGLPDETFQGRVTYIGPALEAESRSLTVEALVDNTDLRLRPGLFATAQLAAGERTDALFVPASAVLRAGDVARLFVARDGVAREKIVTVGDAKSDAKSNDIQILAGLDKNDRVIVNPAGIQDGAKIH